MGPRGGRVFFFLNLNNSFDPAFALRAQTAHRVSLCLRGLATKGGGGTGGVEDTYRTRMGLGARSLKKLYVFRKRMARPSSFITFRKNIL